MTDLVFTQLANGLALGFIYVLVATGLSIIFGMLGLVNFAHGAFFALSAYVALSLFKTIGWAGIALAPIVVACIGMAVERFLLRRAYDKEPLYGLIMTFALALMIEALIRVFWGSASQEFPCLILLFLFMQFTRYGRILRAGARDPEMVGLLGHNLRRIFTGVFGLGTLMAGIAGVLAAPLWSVTPNMSESAIMPAFVTVTIGGLGSYLGAVVAGLLVGVVTALTVQFWPEASAASMYVRPDDGCAAGPATRSFRDPLGKIRMIRRLGSNPIFILSIAFVVGSLLALMVGVPLGRITEVGIYTLYGAGVNLLVGYTGLVPFGASVFFGLASYAASIPVLRWSLGEPLALIVATVFSLVLGLILGAVVLRRRGIYFSLLTLACSQLAFEIAFKWTALTGGENGLQGVSRKWFVS